jgi:hypothetical protein
MNSVNSNGLKNSRIDELLSHAKDLILTGFGNLRDAVEDMASAKEQGASLRAIAKAVGMSHGWVNEKLKWRKGGYQGTPFGPQSKASRRRGQAADHTRRLDSHPAKQVILPPQRRRAAPVAVRSITPEPVGGVDMARLADAETVTPAEIIKAGGLNSIQRGDLIHVLELLGCARPRTRSTVALTIEKRRAELGLTWDELIIPANDADGNAANIAAEEPAS